MKTLIWCWVAIAVALTLLGHETAALIAAGAAVTHGWAQNLAYRHRRLTRP